MSMYIGEALAGDGNEIAHIDLLIGDKTGPVGVAFANALARQSEGHSNLLAVLTPNLICKPATVLITKVTIKGAKQAVQMFGPAQHAVAKAVADSVAEQEAALHSIAAALRPGGAALLRMVPREKGWCIEYILEEVRARPRWSGFFASFRPPFAHFTPDQYRGMAESNGLVVERILVEDGSWDFKSSAAFTAFCSATFVAWNAMVPDTERPNFIADVLDHYRAAACPGPDEKNVFKFQQMEVALRKPAGS